jgi:hypothetical protein
MRDHKQSDARADHAAPATAPQAQGGDTETLASYILNHYGTTPPQIAEGIRASRRGGDPGLWLALQHHVGASQAQHARDAYQRLLAHPTPAAAAATAQPEAGGRVPTERELTYLGVHIIARPNTHASVIDRARQIVAQLLQHNPAAQGRFTDEQVTIVVFPSNVAMTSVPGFEGMERGHHTDTFDGRDWSTVRGSGGIEAHGRFNIGIGEEQLVRVDPRELLGGQRAYPEGYSVGMHELAHALLTKGLSRDQRNQVKHLYDASRRRERRDHQVAFTEAYAASNVDEYFAQCTNAYFGRNGLVGSGNGRAWLAAHDPDMLAFLTRLYEGEPQAPRA